MDDEAKFFGGAILVVLMLIVALVWGGAVMEAKTYNRITGSDVTTWEALWIELRLDCN